LFSFLNFKFYYIFILSHMWVFNITCVVIIIIFLCVISAPRTFKIIGCSGHHFFFLFVASPTPTDADHHYPFQCLFCLSFSAPITFRVTGCSGHRFSFCVWHHKLQQIGGHHYPFGVFLCVIFSSKSLLGHRMQ